MILPFKISLSLNLPFLTGLTCAVGEIIIWALPEFVHFFVIETEWAPKTIKTHITKVIHWFVLECNKYLVLYHAGRILAPTDWHCAHVPHRLQSINYRHWLTIWRFHLHALHEDQILISLSDRLSGWGQFTFKVVHFCFWFILCPLH